MHILRFSSISAYLGVTLLILLTLVACGGGEVQQPVRVNHVQLVIDPTIKEASKKAVTKYVSAAGSSTTIESVPVTPVGANDEILVLSLNANGAILLAILTNSDGGTLSAESTALALTRIYLGRLPTVTSNKVINTAIRNSTGFPALVEATQKNLDDAVAPMTDFKTQSALTALLIELQANASLGLQGNSNQSVRMLAISTTRVNPPLPIHLIQDTTGIISRPISIVGGGVSSVLIRNQMPIPWEVETVSYNGNLLDKVPLGAKDTANPFTNGESITLRLSQNDNTRVEAITKLIYTIATFALEGIPGQSCNAEAMKFALGEAIAMAYKKYKSDAIDNPLLALAHDIIAPSTIATWITSCTVPIASEFLSPILDLYTAGQIIIDSSDAALQGYYLSQYWNSGIKEFGVCVDFQGRIISCSQAIQFNRAVVYTEVGAFIRPVQDLGMTVLSTLGSSSGLQVGFPANLKWSSNESSLVFNQLDGSFKITDTAVGLSGVVVLDPATNVTGQLGLAVTTAPAIEPKGVNGIELGIGEAKVLIKTDGSAHPLFASVENEWSVADSSIASIDSSLFTLLEYSSQCPDFASCRVIVGKAPGSTTLMVKNLSASPPTITSEVITIRSLTYINTSHSKTCTRLPDTYDYWGSPIVAYHVVSRHAIDTTYDNVYAKTEASSSLPISRISNISCGNWTWMGSLFGVTSMNQCYNSASIGNCGVCMRYAGDSASTTIVTEFDLYADPDYPYEMRWSVSNSGIPLMTSDEVAANSGRDYCP